MVIGATWQSQLIASTPLNALQGGSSDGSSDVTRTVTRTEPFWVNPASGSIVIARSVVLHRVKDGNLN